MFTFNTLCILEYFLKNDIKIIKIILLIVILCLITPWSTLKNLFINNKEIIKQTNTFRSQYKEICNYTEELKKGDKVYYISCGSTGIDSHISRYEMVSKKVNVTHGGFAGWSLGPPRYEGDIWSLELSVEDLKNELLNEKYTHVYIFKVDDVFKNIYGSLFEEAEIKNKTMYKINKNKNKVILSELK